MATTPTKDIDACQWRAATWLRAVDSRQPVVKVVPPEQEKVLRRPFYTGLSRPVPFVICLLANKHLRFSPSNSEMADEESFTWSETVYELGVDLISALQST
jgi:hypothetical protein